MCITIFAHPFPFFLKFLFVHLAVLSLLCGTRDLDLWHMNSQLWHVGASSLTRDQIPGLLHWELGVLATGPPGKSPIPFHTTTVVTGNSFLLLANIFQELVFAVNRERGRGIEQIKDSFKMHQICYRGPVIQYVSIFLLAQDQRNVLLGSRISLATGGSQAIQFWKS